MKNVFVSAIFLLLIVAPVRSMDKEKVAKQVPPAYRRIPNDEGKSSPYAWCRTPMDWYTQCQQCCENIKDRCDRGGWYDHNGRFVKNRSGECGFMAHWFCRNRCQQEFAKNKELAKRQGEPR